MESTILIVAMLLLLVLWLYIRRRAAPTAKPRPQRRTTHSNSKFHAVSIKCPASACSAAKAMEGERFLATEAPRLPLPGCDVADCECRFTHHDDRRGGKDRRNVFTASGFSVSTGRFEQERRQGRDRRAGDD